MDLVGSINRSHRILAILNGRDCGFQEDVTDSCWMVLADRMIAVQLDFQVQPVFLEQDRIRIFRRTVKACELFRIL